MLLAGVKPSKVGGGVSTGAARLSVVVVLLLGSSKAAKTTGLAVLGESVWELFEACAHPRKVLNESAAIIVVTVGI